MENYYDLTDEEPRKGIGRLGYFGWFMGLWLVAGVLAVIEHIILASSEPMGAIEGMAALSMGYLVFAIAYLLVGIQRYRNIGYHPAWALLVFIPLVNLVISLQWIALPPGFAQTKQWDLPMKIIIGLHLGVLALLIIAIVSL